MIADAGFVDTVSILRIMCRAIDHVRAVSFWSTTDWITIVTKITLKVFIYGTIV